MNKAPKKLSLDFLKKFDPKYKQEERRDAPPKEPIPIKKINIQEKLNQMNNDKTKSSNQNLNTININSTPNTVFNYY